MSDLKPFGSGPPLKLLLLSHLIIFKERKMKMHLMPPLFISLAIVSFAMSASDGWKENFPEKSKDCHFVSKGSNPYFILEPGYTLELKSGKVDDLLTVLDETKVIDGVETRI